MTTLVLAVLGLCLALAVAAPTSSDETRRAEAERAYNLNRFFPRSGTATQQGTFDFSNFNPWSNLFPSNNELAKTMAAVVMSEMLNGKGASRDTAAALLQAALAQGDDNAVMARLSDEVRSIFTTNFGRLLGNLGDHLAPSS